MLLKAYFVLISVFYTFIFKYTYKNITRVIRFFKRFSCVYVQLLQTLLRIFTHIECDTQ